MKKIIVFLFYCSIVIIILSLAYNSKQQEYERTFLSGYGNLTSKHTKKDTNLRQISLSEQQESSKLEKDPVSALTKTVPSSLVANILEVWAQENEATENSKTIDKINLLKEKVASRVAEIEKTLQYATDGTITQIKEEILTISTPNEQKTVIVDNNTQILTRTNKLKTITSKLSDLDVDDTVTIIGSEQIGTDIISAKLLVISPDTVFFAGTITKINKKNATFTITEAGEEYLFDYEVYTKAFMLGKEKNKLESTGFSNLSKDLKIQILALPNQSSETRFTALRLIVIQ